MRIKLSERIRPNCEAAPWVIEEVKRMEDYIDAMNQQQSVIKEQLTIWKSKARENLLVAGRYQFLFQEAMKFVNYVDDICEYAYASMSRWQLRHTLKDRLDVLNEEVSKLHKSPTEAQDKN